MRHFFCFNDKYYSYMKLKKSCKKLNEKIKKISKKYKLFSKKSEIFGENHKKSLRKFDKFFFLDIIKKSSMTILYFKYPKW